MANDVVGPWVARTSVGIALSRNLNIYTLRFVNTLQHVTISCIEYSHFDGVRFDVENRWFMKADMQIVYCVFDFIMRYIF